MDKKYFPIRTETACQLKWTWSTIRLYSGTTSSCHRTDPDTFDLSTFDAFHNTGKKLRDRELMLAGKWPGRGCEYCRDIEQAGGTSDRLYQLQIPNQYPPELDIDASSIVVTPRIVEVYLDNVCNMKCIYCWDGYSSKIRQENTKFGPFDSQGVMIKNTATPVEDLTGITDKFWNWLRTNGSYLRRLHILGGEPLYQKQFETCLDVLQQNKFPDLQFSIISNLSIDPKYFREIMDRIRMLVGKRHINRFDVAASIDCFGPEQEYVRQGIDLDQWMTNFEYLASQKWIYLNFNQTITSLSMKTMPDMLKYINQARKRHLDREINQQIGLVQHHGYLAPSIFGPGFFDHDFKKILEQMPTETWQQQQIRAYMQGIFKQINSCDRQQDKIDQLIVYLTELDRRRGTDWKQTFPWLERETSYVV